MSHGGVWPVLFLAQPSSGIKMEWMLDLPGHKEHPRYYLIGSSCLPVCHGGEPLNLTVVCVWERETEPPKTRVFLTYLTKLFFGPHPRFPISTFPRTWRSSSKDSSFVDAGLHKPLSSIFLFSVADMSCSGYEWITFPRRSGERERWHHSTVWSRDTEMHKSLHARSWLWNSRYSRSPDSLFVYNFKNQKLKILTLGP